LATSCKISYKHKAVTRNYPPGGVVCGSKGRKSKTKQYGYDPHLDRQLLRAAKADHTSFDLNMALFAYSWVRSSKSQFAWCASTRMVRSGSISETLLFTGKGVKFYKSLARWAGG